MKKILIPFLAFAMLLLPRPVQAARDKDLIPMADSISCYLTENTSVSSYVSVERAAVLKDGTLRLTLSRNLLDHPLRDKEIQDLYSIVRETLPKKYQAYRNKLSLYADKKPVEYYKSRYYTDKPDRKAVEEHRKLAGQHHDKLTAPLVTRLSSASRPDRGLQNRHIALWQSHGWYYEQSLKRWEWQRARVFETVEDLYTQSYVLPFLVPMLENAGAVVLLPRERDWNIHEVIVDNDQTGSGYQEAGVWRAAPDSGFANPKAAYLYPENPFKMGTARLTETDRDGGSSACWLPEIPEDGEYAVYVSYQTVGNSTTAARYEVRHEGGNTRFSVNQQMGGGTGSIWAASPSGKEGTATRAYSCPTSVTAVPSSLPTQSNSAAAWATWPGSPLKSRKATSTSRRKSPATPVSPKAPATGCSGPVSTTPSTRATTT